MSKSRDQESRKGTSKAYKDSRSGAFAAKSYGQNSPKTTLTEKNAHDVIAHGMALIDESTKKQISDIDRMATKYGL
jgi:hypothetical protein